MQALKQLTILYLLNASTPEAPSSACWCILTCYNMKTEGERACFWLTVQGTAHGGGRMVLQEPGAADHSAPDIRGQRQ